MMAHKYKITVEAITTEPSNQPSLIFETQNHDDILAIAERVRQKNWLNDSEANSLAIGLKLFSEVLLAHRQEEIFKDLAPAMSTFIKALKKL